MALAEDVRASADIEDPDEAPDTSGAPREEVRAPDPIVPTEPPKSRRLKAHEELVGRFDKLSAEMKDGFSARDREIARLQGASEAQARMPQWQPPQQASPAPPNVDQMLEDAGKMLEGPKPDFTGYQRKLLEAASAKVRAEMAPMLQQAQQRQPQGGNGIPAALVPHFAANPKLAALGDRAIALLDAKNTEAGARGIQPGPERLAWVFSEAEKALGGGQQTQDRGSAAVLAGAPTSRNGGAGGDAQPGVRLSDSEKKWAKGAGMTLEEYARDIAANHPERVQRG